MTAPKIDTQAPDTSREAIEQLCRTLCQTGSNYAVASEAPATLRALLAERDLSAAREAAAAQAMREAAAKVLRTEAEACRELKTSFRQSDVSLATVGNWLDSYSKQVRALPLPDTTALDRLIAERVREAVDTAELAILALNIDGEMRAAVKMGQPWPIDEMIRLLTEWRDEDGYSAVEVTILRSMQHALAARGSKEGQS